MYIHHCQRVYGMNKCCTFNDQKEKHPTGIHLVPYMSLKQCLVNFFLCVCTNKCNKALFVLLHQCSCTTGHASDLLSYTSIMEIIVYISGRLISSTVINSINTGMKISSIGKMHKSKWMEANYIHYSKKFLHIIKCATKKYIFVHVCIYILV